MAAEEQERIQTDLQYAMEEAERRREAIDRAKRLQYNNQDSVRAFHSRVLLYQVLKERDLQLQMKQQRNQLEENVESNKILENQSRLEDDAKVQIEARRKQHLLAQDQQRQIREKASRAKEEKLLDRLEGKELAVLDQEYRESLKKEEEKRKLNCLSLRDQLLHIRDDIKMREEVDKKLKIEESKRSEAWIARKSKQSEMKKEVEKNDAIRMREQLGEVQAKLNIDADARIEAQMKIAIEKKASQEKKEELDRAEKKKHQQRELRDYFQEYLRKSEIRQKESKALEREELEGYKQIREETIKEQKQKKLTALREGKELQDHHRAQMERIRKIKKKEKEDRLEGDKLDVIRIDQEDQHLLSYMRALAMEDWALDDQRLQRYVAQAPEALFCLPKFSDTKETNQPCITETKQKREDEVYNLKAVCDEVAAQVMDYKQAERAGLPLDEYTSSIDSNMEKLMLGIAALEEKLEKSEQAGSTPGEELRLWEAEILNLSKAHDRLEYMYKPDIAMPVSRKKHSKTKTSFINLDDATTQLDSGELLQLQTRIMDEQDIHLDILSESIQRQKNIGLRIGEELELHVDLLEETENAVDATTSRLGESSRRLNQVQTQSKTNTQVAKELENALGLTDEAYAEYISQLIEDESIATEEKFEIIKSKDVKGFVDELLRKADLKKQEESAMKESAAVQAIPASEAELEVLREIRITDEPKKKMLTKEERRKRDQLLAKYGYDVDDIVEGADGEAEVVYKGESSSNDFNSESLLSHLNKSYVNLVLISFLISSEVSANDNAAKVRDVEQQRRAKLKAEHEVVQQRNKAALEKQLLDKEKEKRRTQKKEKRRM
ncbi:hypothetical protein HDU67_000531 [Dinochytrium kinnereticum]|nr:hypothetical protein HDU67_000531 [Dinochytrium kinnereticum]